MRICRSGAGFTTIGRARGIRNGGCIIIVAVGGGIIIGGRWPIFTMMAMMITR